MTEQSSTPGNHRYQLPIPPHAPALFSSADRLNPSSTVPSMSVTDAVIPGPSHIAPLETSIQAAHPRSIDPADPEAAKRQRMAQHTKDLEAWVLSANNPPPPPERHHPPPPRLTGAAALSAIAAAVNAIEDVSDQDAEGEDDLDLAPVPPTAPAAKRARTSAASSSGANNSHGNGGGGRAPLTAPRKGKAGAIARKYLMETDHHPADDDQDFLPTRHLPPLPPPKVYQPPSALPGSSSLAVANAGHVVTTNAKGKRKAGASSGSGPSASRRASGSGGGGSGGGGGATANGNGASTGTALVTKNIHAAAADGGSEEPIVGPDPTPAALVALYPLRPRPARPPRARPPRSSSSAAAAATTTSGDNSPIASSSAAGGGGTTTTKGPLLSAAQKKANHIASEQKRRAAIRKGYDGLCEVVPTLKAAVEEFEERVRKVAVTGPYPGGESQSPPAAPVAAPPETTKVAEKGGGVGGKRQGRGKGGESTTGALMGGISVGGEKIDGRAGPKSEAVVLTQTVEHIRRLLSDRTELLAKLSHLHASAGPFPPPTTTATGVAVMTREWDDRWDDGMREEMGIALADEDWEDE